VPGRPAGALARDGPPEQERADRGDDQREDREASAADADDRQHDADDSDDGRDAAGHREPVRALLARPARRIAASAFKVAHYFIVSGVVGYARSMDARRLENRLAIAAGMWRESVEDPLPKLSPGDPEAQVDEFEMRLIDALEAQATPETAKGIAERTWDLVHDRADDDPVKKHVTELHERLAKMATPGVT
jgi:hypothetical protein